MATDVAVPAASSPAEPQPNFDPSTWSASQHSAWMADGTVPESPTEESTPSEESAGGSDEPETPATASAPETQQKHKGKGAEDRKAQLSSEIQDLLKQRAALRAEITGKKEGAKPESPAAPEKKAGALVEPEEPKPGDEPWSEYLAKLKQYHKDLAKFTAQQTLAEERAAEQKSRTEQETAEKNKAIEQSWQKRVQAAAKVHGDYAEVVEPLGADDSPIKAGSVVDAFLLDSDHGAELLYALGKDPDKLSEICGMSPFKATRALIEMESFLSPGKAGKSSVTPITRAAKPATDLRATNNAPDDPRRAAIETDDFTAYQEMENRRDIERRKGRG